MNALLILRRLSTSDGASGDRRPIAPSLPPSGLAAVADKLSRLRDYLSWFLPVSRRRLRELDRRMLAMQAEVDVADDRTREALAMIESRAARLESWAVRRAGGLPLEPIAGLDV